MIKSILIFLSFSPLLFSTQQILLVVADEFTSKHAKLEFFEDEKILFTTDVNLGENGLGWGLGEVSLLQKRDEPLKYEGDKKAPAGVFQLREVFGYASRSESNLPYFFASKELICVDESASVFYNQIIMKKGDEKSFEYMKRSDDQYLLGVVVAHNKEGKKGRGSCIFLHIEKEPNATTAGCSAMKKENLQTIVRLLDKKKNPLLIQIPSSSAKEVLQLYPQLKKSNLLHPHHQKSLSQ